MTSDSTPAFEIEKEALKTEIETGIQAGVDHLEAKTAKRKDADKYHNTRHLLKQYRKVAYAIQISEADMNVRMEMEHGTRLSTLEVNAELAGVDLSGSKLEGYARTVIRSKNMLQIIDNALNTVRMDPDHGELMYQVLYLTYFSKKKPANREVILNRGEQQASACCSQIIRFSCDVRDTRMSSIGTSNNAPRAYRLSTEGRLFPCCHL